MLSLGWEEVRNESLDDSKLYIIKWALNQAYPTFVSKSKLKVKVAHQQFQVFVVSNSGLSITNWYLFSLD